jgi:type III secretion protein J
MSPSFFRSSRRIFFVFLAAFHLAGCKEVLYSGLSETQANEMVAALAQAGIPSWRSRDKGSQYELSVESDSIAISIVELNRLGLPREEFLSIGDVFGEGGIIGTPFEQQARFVHAMNQELSHTISLIPGVRTARVFVTMSQKDRFERETAEASASVAVYFEQDFDISAQVPKIKMLVSHSAGDLEYDKVSVALFPVVPAVQSLPQEAGHPQPVSVPRPNVRTSSILGSLASSWRLIAFLIGCVILIFAFRVLLFPPTKPKRKRS